MRHCLHACLCCSSFPYCLPLTCSFSDPHRPARCACALQLGSALFQEVFQDLCHQDPSVCYLCLSSLTRAKSPERRAMQYPYSLASCGQVCVPRASGLCLSAVPSASFHCATSVRVFCVTKGKPKIQFRLTRYHSCPTTLICLPLVQGHTCDTRTTIP